MNQELLMSHPRAASKNGRPLFEILHETEEWLALNKPAGLVCHPTKGDEYSSLISRIRLYLNPRQEAHLINRLDRETSGVILAGKDRETARELKKAFESRLVEKRYLAITHGAAARPGGVIDAPLGPDEHSEVAIKDCVRVDGAPSLTGYVVLKTWKTETGEFSLLSLEPRTGRKHQIRIHLNHIGHPIVGDKMYGTDPSAYLDFVKDRLSDRQRRALILPWQALHAERLAFEWRGRRWEYACDPEPWFLDFIDERPEEWKRT